MNHYGVELVLGPGDMTLCLLLPLLLLLRPLLPLLLLLPLPLS